MDGRTFFSICMPALNAAGVIARAIESVQAQTFADWELIVVVDGSTDSTAEVVTGFSAGDSRIRLLEPGEKQGCGAARARAVAAAHAPYLCRLDADDSYDERFLEVFRDAIEAHPGHAIYSCNAMRVEPDGARRPLLEGDRFSHAGSWNLTELIEQNTIYGGCVFSREAYDSVGGTRPEIYLEDWDLWLRMLVAGYTHYYIPEVLADYVIGPGQMIADRRQVIQSKIEVLEDLRDGLAGDSIALSALDRSLAQQRRTLLDIKLAEGNLEGVRGLYLRVGGTYEKRWKYALALPLMLLSPAWFKRATKGGTR